MRNSPLRTALAVGPFVAALFAAVSSDVTAFQTLRYAVWTTLWWAVGTALVAAVAPGLRSRFSALTFGGVVGVIAQLLFWAIMVALGLGSYLPAAGVGAILAVGLSAPLRNGLLNLARTQGLEQGNTDEAVRVIPTSALAAWAAGATTLCLAAAAFFHSQTLPPRASSMYQDLYWHLGIAAELQHHVVPHVIESRTGRLNYHWLSDAFMAAGSLGSHVPTMFVAERLWLLPIVLLSPALLVLVARQVARSWSGSWIVVLVTTVGATLPVLPWQGLGPAATYLFLSPSQVFGVPMTLLAASLMVFFLRRGSMRAWDVVLMAGVYFLCAGSKSSIVPVFLCGTLAVLLTHLTARTPQRRGRRTVALGLLVSQAVAFAAAMPLFAGGSAGSKIRLLGHLRHWDVVTHVTHHPHALDHGPFLPPGLNLTSALVLAALVVAVLVSYGVGAFSLFLGRRTWSEDAVPALLTASFLASVAAYLLIDHTGQSEAYFPMGAMPLLALLAGWGWARVWDGADRSRRRQLVVGLLVGAAVGLLEKFCLPDQFPQQGGSLLLWLGLPMLIAAAVILAVGVLSRREASRVGAVAALVALAAAAPTQGLITTIFNGLTTTPPTTRSSVLPAESAAAAWIRHHTPAGTVVATNVHCLFVKRVPNCTSSAYWTSGLTERQMLVGSWGYTDGAQSRAGAGGHPAINQSFPDARTFDLNEAMFYAPTDDVARRMKDAGVSYLFADSRVAPVSPDLSQVAQRVRTWGPVTVYRMR